MEAIAIAARVSLQLLTISIRAAGTKCLHQVNRRGVITNLLVWMSGILKKSS